MLCRHHCIILRHAMGCNWGFGVNHGAFLGLAWQSCRPGSAVCLVACAGVCQVWATLEGNFLGIITVCSMGTVYSESCGGMTLASESFCFRGLDVYMVGHFGRRILRPTTVSGVMIDACATTPVVCASLPVSNQPVVGLNNVGN